MKKFLCCFLSVVICLSASVVAFSQKSAPWEDAYAKIIGQHPATNETNYILADIDANGVPELILGNQTSVFVYTYQNDSAMKIAEFADTSVAYFEHLKYMQNNKTNLAEWIGQSRIGSDLHTYKIKFHENAVQITPVSIVHQDNTGAFYGDSSEKTSVPDCTALTSEYLRDYSILPTTLSVLTQKEVTSFDIHTATNSFFARHQFLRALSDDTSTFSAHQQDAIKKLLGKGTFVCFDKLSIMENENIFVQFYTAPAENNTLILEKRYAVITQNRTSFAVKNLYWHESELNTEYLSTLIVMENTASNLEIDYKKTTSFRGIDDYVNYLSVLLSSAKEEINESGKRDVAQYMEHAVNRSSRTQVKANDNTITVDDYAVSFIAENAAMCMERLYKVCATQNLSLSMPPRIIPELVCENIDLAKPIHMEFKRGLAQTLEKVSGIRLMLDNTHGMYVATADLKVLESSLDAFCLEYEKTDSGCSVAFSDGNTASFDYLPAPVWCVLPAESEYSTVMATYSGNADNWGGQFDEKNKTIAFSTNYAGSYDVATNDIAISDIDALPQETKDAIQFLVSKGILSVNNKHDFRPQELLNRYDFTTALVKMLYATNIDAHASFKDVAKSNAYYRYIASAQAQNLLADFVNGDTFRGKNAVSKEQLTALCGKILMEKKGYVPSEEDASLLKYTDIDKISPWAKPYLAVAVRFGLMNNAGDFSPIDTVTRAEGANLLYETFMQLYNVSPVAPVVSSQETQSPSQDQETQPLFDLEFRLAICIFITILFVFLAYLAVKINKHKKKKEKNKE